ncbi:hypothetical protein GCM10020369_01420 [Cryptosporangium minutisporangium]|uniref:Uncharacterized protein n=1 Tax=Cryptosporangium minutisporangium TaxID=113569 RepID=A0ABP6SQB5_9ACTN
MTRLVHAARNGTPRPAETPYRVTISPASPTDTLKLVLSGVSRPIGINSVVRKTNRLAVMAATPSHGRTAEDEVFSRIVTVVSLARRDQ